jgi:hypothetical protein
MISSTIAKRCAAVLLAALAAMIVACSRELRGENARDLAVAVERLLSEFEAPAQTRKLLQRVTDAAWRLDAAALHAALPASGSADQERSVLFEARQEQGRRLVSHRVARSLELRPSSPPGVGEEPGDGWLLLGAMPLANPSGDYRLRVGSALSTGSADSVRVWQGLPDDLRDLESDTLMQNLRTEFPRTMELVLRYVEIQTASRPVEGRARAIAVIVRSRLEPLGADYPNLEGYVSRLARCIRGSGALQSGGGATLVSWSFREPNDELKISLRSADGRLVPDEGPEPVVDLLASQHLRLVYSSSIEAYGVRTRIEGIRGTIHTDPSRAAAEIRSQFSGEPDRLAVEGALFGFVPVPAVDVLIPGSLEGAVRGILSTLLRGRDGQGIEVVTALRTETSKKHTVRSTLLSDVPAGRFARLALRLAASLVQANDRQRAELLQVARDFVGRLRADLSG